MTQKISIIILASVVVLVSAVLSGCGSASPTTAQQFGGALNPPNIIGTPGQFGSVTITGSTSIVFTPGQGYFTTFNGSSSITWAYMQLSPYIYTYVDMPLNSLGTPTSCSLSHVVSTINGNNVISTSYFYSTAWTGFTGITVNPTTRTVIFNNVSLSGLNGGVFTTISALDSVTFNGTLKY